MASRAGLKDRQIILRAPVDGKSTTGGPITTYPVDTHTVWAHVIPASGSERFRGQREISIQDLIFEVYYLSDVTVKWQIGYESENYDIQSVAEFKRREGLQIVARLAE